MTPVEYLIGLPPGSFIMDPAGDLDYIKLAPVVDRGLWNEWAVCKQTGELTNVEDIPPPGMGLEEFKELFPVLRDSE